MNIVLFMQHKRSKKANKYL